MKGHLFIHNYYLPGTRERNPYLYTLFYNKHESYYFYSNRSPNTTAIDVLKTHEFYTDIFQEPAGSERGNDSDIFQEPEVI